MALFVTHYGADGVREALFARTPMLLLPRVAGQHMNAKRAEELGAGSWCRTYRSCRICRAWWIAC